MLRWKSKRACFEEAALAHLDALYRFAVYLCRNESDADDLLQDTFLSAFRKSHQFKTGTNLKAWLFRIARNAHIDRLRRRKREVELNETTEAARSRDGTLSRGSLGADEGYDRRPLWEGQSCLPPAGNNEHVFHDLFGDEVNRFLNELPSEFRLALVLCDVEGLSYKEISDALDCPVGTVRSRISRARSQLREKLHSYARDLGYVKETKT